MRVGTYTIYCPVQCPILITVWPVITALYCICTTLHTAWPDCTNYTVCTRAVLSRGRVDLLSIASAPTSSPPSVLAVPLQYLYPDLPYDCGLVQRPPSLAARLTYLHRVLDTSFVWSWHRCPWTSVQLVVSMYMRELLAAVGELALAHAGSAWAMDKSRYSVWM